MRGIGCLKSSHGFTDQSFLCDSLAPIEVVACITLGKRLAEGAFCKVAVARPLAQLEGCTFERCQRERESVCTGFTRTHTMFHEVSFP